MPDIVWTFVVVAWTVFLVTFSVTKLKMHRCGGGLFTFEIPLINKQKWIVRAIVVVYIVAAFLFSLSMTFPVFDNLQHLSKYYFILRGAILFVIAILLYIFSRVTLGCNWKWTGELVGDRRKLIKKGPYKFIRHPQYTSLILALIATGLMLTDSRIIVFTFLIIPFAYAKSILDEQYLYFIFPEYSDYIKKTGRFF